MDPYCTIVLRFWPDLLQVGSSCIKEHRTEKNLSAFPMPLKLLGTEKFFLFYVLQYMKSYLKCKRSGQNVEWAYNMGPIELIFFLFQLYKFVLWWYRLICKSYLPHQSRGMHQFFILNICRTCCENSPRHSDHHLRAACWRHLAESSHVFCLRK